jgi:alpha-glucosidase
MEEENNREDKQIIADIVAGQTSEEVIQHLNNPVTDLKPIVKQYLTKVKGVKKEGNKFYFSDGSARVEVRVVSDEIIRVRLAPHGVFLADFSYAVEVVDQNMRLDSYFYFA